MKVIKMGVNPDIAKRERLQRELDNWRARLKHRRCGTIVELDARDVKVLSTMLRPYTSWTCPCCNMGVPISTWHFPARLSWFKLGFLE